MGLNKLYVSGTVIPDNVYIDTSLSYNKPERRVTSYSIPGRSGNLIIDEQTPQNGVVYNNVTITYPAFIHGDFKTTWDALINGLGRLQGYHKMECDADPNHFRMGRVIIPQAPDVKHIGEDAFFNMSFDCKPQRFLYSGDALVEWDGGSLHNPTNFDSYPLLKITGTGSIRFVSGDVTVTITSPTAYTYIDCETMTCYYNKYTSLNQYVSFDKPYFPALYQGNNFYTIESEGITKVEVKPRWWEL